METEILDYLEEHLDAIADSIINLLAERGQFIDVSNAEIGSPFKVATDQEYTQNVFPILYNGEVVLSASVTKDGDNYFMAVSSLYNDALNDSSGTLLFFAAEGNTYVDVNGEVKPVALYHYDYTEEELEQLEGLTDTVEEFTYRMPEKLPEAAAAFTEKAVLSDTISTLPTVASVDWRSHTVVIPVIYQDRANTCWAAACASIIKKYTKQTYTPSGICRQIHGFTHESGCTGGLIPDDIYKALTTLGPINCDRYFTKFNYHNMANHISSRNVAIGHGEIPKTNKGHEVIVNGIVYEYKSQNEWVLDLVDSVAGEVELWVKFNDTIETDYFIYENYVFKDMIYIREY